jgi:HK97 family phage portal protein
MWPFSTKLLKQDLPTVSGQIKTLVKSVSIPQAAPDWKLFAKKDTKWDIATAVNEGYNASAAVYTCVEKRAKLASSVPWSVKQKKADGTFEDAPDHPLQKLIDMPNPETSWMEIMHEIIQQLDLAGNAYLSEIKAGVNGYPTQLWLLPSQYMKIKPGKVKLVDAYEYQETSSTKFTILSDDMVQLKLPNPNSRYFGQPTLMAAGRATDIDRESGIWQKNSLENRGIVDLHIEVPDTTQPDQIDALKAKVKEKQTGSDNAREPWITSGKINQLGQSAVEMDFVESRKAVWAEICAVFGLSMSVLGFTESVNLANAAEQQKALWVNTIIPLLELIKRQLNAQLASEFDGVELHYDLSNVEAMQENFTEKLTNAESLYRMGYSNEAINRRLELGFEADEMPQEAELATDEKAAGAISEPQKVALNGAQISSLREIIMTVSTGELTPAAARQLLSVAFPAVDPAVLSGMVDAAGEIDLPDPEPAAGVADGEDDAQVKRLLKAVGYGN